MFEMTYVGNFYKKNKKIPSPPWGVGGASKTPWNAVFSNFDAVLLENGAQNNLLTSTFGFYMKSWVTKGLSPVMAMTWPKFVVQCNNNNDTLIMLYIFLFFAYT